MFLGKITSYILELLLAFALGFMACVVIMKNSEARKQAKAQSAVISNAAASVVKSQNESDKIEARIASSTASAETAKRIIYKTKVVRLKDEIVSDSAKSAQKLPENCISPDSDFGDRAVLTAGTVRVLNEIRAGKNPDAAASSDAASETPSQVSVRDFIQNDTEVVRLYNDLAIRHNALVDWVENELKKQAEK